MIEQIRILRHRGAVLCGAGRRIRVEGLREMCARGREVSAILEGLMKRCFVPGEDFHRIEMEDRREGIELVECGHNVAILDVGEAADVQGKLGPAAIHSDFVTGFLYATIGKS